MLDEDKLKIIEINIKKTETLESLA